jgi:hypothetical protein
MKSQQIFLKIDDFVCDWNHASDPSLTARHANRMSCPRVILFFVQTIRMRCTCTSVVRPTGRRGVSHPTGRPGIMMAGASDGAGAWLR